MAQTATVQIQMPEMGESVTEGIVLEWHVAEGDFVNEGDTVVEVSTDKVDAEVPAPADGVITKLIASVDEEVPVGAPLAEMEPGEGGSSAGNGTAEGSDGSTAGPVVGDGGAPRAGGRPRPPHPPRHPRARGWELLVAGPTGAMEFGPPLWRGGWLRPTASTWGASAAQVRGRR